MSGTVTRAKVGVALDPDQRADEAAAAVLLALVRTVREDFEGALAGGDPEYLHQLRIAVRRSRTVQRQLAPVFPPVALPGYRVELRWLQRATGPARDLDVHVGEFASMADGDALRPLRQVLERRRDDARASMAAALRSRRTRELLEDWSALLHELPELPEGDRPWAPRPIQRVAGKRIRRAYERIRRMGRAIGPSSPGEEYHELRKKGKELRYLLELFGAPLFDPEPVDGLVRSLKDLQDVLGRHQDREVQVALLRSVAGEVDVATAGAIATLVERLREDELAARREFAQRFEPFAAPERRRLVRETFR